MSKRVKAAVIENMFALKAGTFRDLRRHAGFPEADSNSEYDFEEAVKFATLVIALPAIQAINGAKANEILDLKREQARAEKAKADKLELELLIMKNEVISVDYVQSELSKTLIGLKQSLLTQMLSSAELIYEAETIEHAKLFIKQIIIEAVNHNTTNEELFPYEIEEDEVDGSGIAENPDDEIN